MFLSLMGMPMMNAHDGNALGDNPPGDNPPIANPEFTWEQLDESADVNLEENKEVNTMHSSLTRWNYTMNLYLYW